MHIYADTIYSATVCQHPMATVQNSLMPFLADSHFGNSSVNLTIYSMDS